MQEDEPWRKVAKNLSTWQRRIYQFREKEKWSSNQEEGFEKVSLETLKKLKVSPQDPSE